MSEDEYLEAVVNAPAVERPQAIADYLGVPLSDLREAFGMTGGASPTEPTPGDQR